MQFLLHVKFKNCLYITSNYWLHAPQVRFWQLLCTFHSPGHCWWCLEMRGRMAYREKKRYFLVPELHFNCSDGSYLLCLVWNINNLFIMQVCVYILCVCRLPANMLLQKISECKRFKSLSRPSTSFCGCVVYSHYNPHHRRALGTLICNLGRKNKFSGICYQSSDMSEDL